jgi:UDP-glucose 4-epimerase
MSKKILITGENSYIGTSFVYWLSTWPEKYAVDTVSTLNDGWKTKNFARYDAVLHVAGIAHQKEKPDMAELYQKVNTQLAVEIAQKAKQDGVGQFVFMSTMAVYGLETGRITPDTTPIPKTIYGKSKLEAERQLKELNSESFLAVILRPPMVYGPGCPGNYTRLSRLIRKIPIFPKVSNERSMIYIDHLCEFLRQVIDQKLGGVFFPQNKEYVCTKELAACIANNYGKRLFFSCLLGVLVTALPVKIFKKIFGSLVYDKSMSGDFSYCKIDFEQTVQRCTP